MCVNMDDFTPNNTTSHQCYPQRFATFPILKLLEISLSYKIENIKQTEIYIIDA